MKSGERPQVSRGLKIIQSPASLSSSCLKIRGTGSSGDVDAPPLPSFTLFKDAAAF